MQENIAPRRISDFSLGSFFDQLSDLFAVFGSDKGLEKSVGITCTQILSDLSDSF